MTKKFDSSSFKDSNKRFSIIQTEDSNTMRNKRKIVTDTQGKERIIKEYYHQIGQLRMNKFWNHKTFPNLKKYKKETIVKK